MMTTETRCDGTPFPDGGRNLNALYFTKAPGEEYLRVYAQYNNDPCWVPLPVTLPAFPDLQQVRDAGRNISIASGSYEDAHFYLRSADGNNMTAAYFTNAAGGGIQVGNADDYAPLNLQPEGGVLTYGGAEVATENWVQQYSLTRKSDVVTNFNTIISSGIYTINSGLGSIANYPHIGNNNNGATAGYLVVYQTGSGAVQLFYPTNETATLNRGGGYWYRRSATDVWEYKNGVLDIRSAVSPVHANALEITGDYLISGFRTAIIAQGYPDPGTDIPLMLTVRKRWGNAPQNYVVSQEAVALQESPANFTRKWIRSRFNWHGAVAWDSWNEIGLLRDVYTKAQLNTSGAGGSVHWNNVSNKPAIVSAETDPTVPDHVKNITQAFIDSWNAKENAVNKSTSATLGTSDILFPTQKAVKTYVDTAITNNNADYIPAGQKGTANGVATLGSNGKIPDAQIPAIAITNTSTVASQAAMLAITAEVGDVAVRTDINKSFILQTTPASTLSNWVELRSPTITNSDQVPEGTSNLYFTNNRARNALSGVAPVTYNVTTGQIGIVQAGSGANGYLSSTDWSVFNSKESAIAKNTAFNKNFGTTSGTVAEGNDNRINNGQTAFGWGNHAAAGYLKTETDPIWTAAKSQTLTLAELLGNNVDLNTRTTTGIYFQNNNIAAQSGANYPVPFAGKLEVTSPYADFVYQDYHAYADTGTGNNRRYWRSYYAGNWSAWQEATQSLQAVRNIDPQVWGTGQIYYRAGIQLRESDFAGSSAIYGPRIAFHWGGVVASQIAMQYSGRISIVDNPGTGYQDLVARTVFTSAGFRHEADHSLLVGSSDYWGLYTASNGAHPLKVGALTISESYTDNAPVNGLFVKGNTLLRGDKTVIGKTIGSGEAITLVLGYSDAAGEYEKVKLISNRLDGAARQDFHIAINNEYSIASATIADSRLKIDGITGAVSLAQLGGTGTRMVVADDAGVLSAQPIPAGDNWWDHNSYPANWVTPRNTDSGPAQGIETGGGLATQGITTRDTVRVVNPEDHTLIFSKTVSLEMPDPAEFPYRMLRLRVNKGARILFSNLNICDIESGTSLPEFEGCGDNCGISRGHTVDLQSIKDESGIWRWFITAMTN